LDREKKPIKIKKTDRFGFGFISLKPKKLNRTQTEKMGKKPSQTEKTKQNQKKPR